MNKKKIITIVGALIAICLIAAVSIPALGNRSGKDVAEPPVNMGDEKQEPTGTVKDEENDVEPPADVSDEEPEDTGEAKDEDVTGAVTDTTPNDGSGDGVAHPTENEPANGDNDEGDGPETPADGSQEETPPEPTEANKSGEETWDDATPPTEDETSDSEIVPQVEDDSREEPTGAASTVTDPAEPPEDDKTQPTVDPDDIPAGSYGPEVDVGTDPEEYGGLTPEEEEMIRQANESTITDEDREKLRELFGEDGMSGY